MIKKEVKNSVIEQNRLHETDTGSPEVQIAILTARINELPSILRKTPMTIIQDAVFLKWLVTDVTF